MLRGVVLRCDDSGAKIEGAGARLIAACVAAHETGPDMFQDYGNPISYRHIRIREKPYLIG